MSEEVPLYHINPVWIVFALSYVLIFSMVNKWIEVRNLEINISQDNSTSNEIFVVAFASAFVAVPVATFLTPFIYLYSLLVETR